QAAFSIAVGKDKGAFKILKELYSAITVREIRKQIVFTYSILEEEGKNDGIEELIKIAEAEPDREVKKQALFWLGQKAGERSLKVLGDAAYSADGDTEVQKQAVFAISQRRDSEAVPLLINIAKTHPKAEVRKQALFWLGQSNDERALKLFKEILEK